MNVHTDVVRSRADNPLARKERVLFTLKWLALVAFIVITGLVVYASIQTTSNTNAAPADMAPPGYSTSPSPNPPQQNPEPAATSMIGPISWLLFFIIAPILILILFVMHVENLPREILGPIIHLLKSLDFEIVYQDGRHVTCKPRLEPFLSKVREITLQFPGNALASVRTCILRVCLNQEQIKSIDIKHIAADQGFIVVGGDSEPGMARSSSCLVTSIDVRRVHAKSLNLRMLLHALQ